MFMEVISYMETKNVILELRNNARLSQDELAEKVCVTRQAVSRWENGQSSFMFLSIHFWVRQGN